MGLFEYDDKSLSNYEEMKIHQNNKNWKICFFCFFWKGKRIVMGNIRLIFEKEELATKNQMDLWGKH